MRSAARHAVCGLALCMLLLTLGGCSTVADYFQGGTENIAPPTPLEDLENSLPVQTLWKRSVGSGADDAYLKLSPVTDGENLYVAEREGTVSALAAASGDRRWETDTEVLIAGGPGVGAAHVYVGSSNGEVIALGREDGSAAWTTRVSSEVLSPPVEQAGVVVVRTVDGKLTGLDAVSGERLWVYDRSVPVLTLRGTSTPAMASGAVIAGFDSGRLVALDLKNGQQLWETAVASPTGRSELERMVDIDADPVIADDIIYAATFQGRVSALDLYTGNVVWRRDMSSHAGLAVDAKNVYVSDTDSQVWSLERSGSASLWRQDKLRARAISAPAVVDRYIVVGDLEGYVHWLNRDDGGFAARTQVDGGAIVAQPLVVGDTAYVYSSGGTLTALALR